MTSFDLESAARAIMPKDISVLASSSHLAMHITPALVLVAVTDVASQQPMWMQEFAFPDDISSEPAFEFVGQRNWFDQVFRKVTASFETNVFTIIPEPFFDKTNMADVLRFNFRQHISETHQLELREADSRLIYENPLGAASLFKRAPHARLLPLPFLMTRFALHPQWNESSQINLCISGNQLVMTAMKNGRFMLVNAYAIASETDVLYHLSNLAIQLEFDLQNVPILVLKAKDVKTFEILKAYCGNLRVELFKNAVHPILHLHSVCA
jgi:hypothetical protein